MVINKWIAGCLLAGCLLSCEGFQQNNRENEYYYFPEKNVYYDVNRDMYLFSLDNGTTWDSMANKLEGIPPVLGERQVIHSNADPVWANNEADRAQYSGNLYNVINDESLKPAETDARITTKSTSTKSQTQKDTRKRPIKKFFDKLFGKKKKDG